MSGATQGDATSRERLRVPLGRLAIATVLTASTLAVVWFVAVPLGPVACPAIMPPPTNCMSSYREGTALVISVATVSIYAATVVGALTIGRRRPAIVTAGIVVLTALLVTAWPLIGLLAGFPLA